MSIANRLKGITRWLFLLAPLLANLSFAAEKKPFVVGVVPQFDPKRIQETWVPILATLEEKTGYRFTLRNFHSIPEFEQQFNFGTFDFAYMNPYHIVRANQAHGYIPLVRDVGSQLYGVLLVKKDSPFKDIKDLSGKKIAFPSVNAIGASLLVRKMIKDTYGITYDRLYVRSHDSVILNVIGGFTDAGGVVAGTIDLQPLVIRNQLRILATTEGVAPHPFTAHPRVPEDVRAAVQKAFFTMGDDSEGMQLLKNIPIKRVGIASMSDYEPIRKMQLEKLEAPE